MIDIRSDTVTFPTEAMRKAMAAAEVGDDVYGDDPTVNRLEKRGAETLGKEAAVFVPSGTFGNQLALFTWAPRGSEVLLGEECHIIQHEAGAASIIAGVQTRPVPAPAGVLDARALRERMRKRDLHFPATSLVCVENAHSSGRVVPLAAMDEIYSAARGQGLPVHLDGARIFNAAAAMKKDAAGIARRADSVMFCLSKGLCAPVGSLLAGPRDFIEEARYKRKIMGGGMRQAGILAAAGIVALEENTKRLDEDHGRAKILARFLSEIPGITLDIDEVEINMVFFSYKAAQDFSSVKPEKPAEAIVDCMRRVHTPPLGAKKGYVPGDKYLTKTTYPAEPQVRACGGVVDFFKRRGILINAPENGLFRFVTHYWIGDSEIEKILAASREAFGGV